MASDRRRQRGPNGQGGFVLALVLWLLAGIAIVAGLLTIWALDQVRDAQRDRSDVEDLAAMMSTRDTVVYLAATRDVTLAGLPVEPISGEERAVRSLDEFGALDRGPVGGEIRVDGHAYEGLGGVVFSVQDEAGLIPLIWPTPDQLDRMLEQWGIDAREAPRLRDALLDYTDTDDLRHLNGAEEREYEVQDLPPPPNRRLLVPAELGRVLAWDEMPLVRREQLQEMSTTFYAGALNLNSAPPAVLPLLIDGCPANCDTLRMRRSSDPFRGAAEIEALLGVRLPGDTMVDYRFAPSDTLRLTLWSRTGVARRVHVRLTPLADGRAPWAFLAAYHVDRPGTDEPPQSIDSALFADAATGRP